MEAGDGLGLKALCFISTGPVVSSAEHEGGRKDAEGRRQGREGSEESLTTGG